MRVVLLFLIGLAPTTPLLTDYMAIIWKTSLSTATPVVEYVNYSWFCTDFYHCREANYPYLFGWGWWFVSDTAGGLYAAFIENQEVFYGHSSQY